MGMFLRHELGRDRASHPLPDEFGHDKNAAPISAINAYLNSVLIPAAGIQANSAAVARL